MQINKKNLDTQFIKKWSEYGVDPIVSSILFRRGYTDTDDILNLLDPIFETQINPFEFSQIVTAFERLEKAIANNEKIIVYGDKDVDGTTSVAILTSWLEDVIKSNNSQATLDWDVPTGSNQYGLSADKINTWAGKYNLCITVDCGITNTSEINLLSTYGIDCIVIDHHENLEILPECVAIINPMCEQDFKQRKIAACVVTLLFIIGYTFYKSQFYNKKIGIIYTNNNKITVDTYINMKHSEATVYNKLSQTECGNCDYNFFYAEKPNFTQQVTDFFKAKKIEPLFGGQLISPCRLKFFQDKSDFAKTALIKTLYSQISEIDNIRKRYILLATLGTIADVMPLLGINRAIVKEGLSLMRQGRLKNITDMVNRAELDLATLSSRDLAWVICPLLNASGRMGDATITVFFLQDKSNSGFYLDAIFNNNKERKNQEEFALSMFKKQFDANKEQYENIAFFYSDKIHKGITGIVAAHLSEYTGVPTIVAAKDGELYVGSIRGKSDTSFVDFLSGCADLLDNFGGHHAAAGFSLPPDNLIEFADFVYENGGELKSNTAQTIYEIDAEVPKKYLGLDLFKKLSVIEPYGPENETPLLYTQQIEVQDFSFMGKNRSHLKLHLSIGDNVVVGVFWSGAKWFSEIHQPTNKYNILYRLELNKYRGNITPQLMIQEMELG